MKEWEKKQESTKTKTIYRNKKKKNKIENIKREKLVNVSSRGQSEKRKGNQRKIRKQMSSKIRYN